MPGRAPPSRLAFFKNGSHRAFIHSFVTRRREPARHVSLSRASRVSRGEWCDRVHVIRGRRHRATSRRDDDAVANAMDDADAVDDARVRVVVVASSRRE